MNLEKILLQFGLDKKQAKIYLACLELGSASVYKIAQKAQMSRSTCYEVMDELNKKGMVTAFTKKKIKYYNAENPQIAIEQEKEKIKLLERAMPEFNAFYQSAKNKPNIRFYQGVEGMKLILKEMIKETDEVLSFTSFEDLFSYLGDWWPEYLKMRIKNKIRVKVIMSDSEIARERKRLGPEQLREVRLVSPRYKHHSTYIIWSNKIAMFAYKKELISLVIESPVLSETHRAMFYMVWDNLEK